MDSKYISKEIEKYLSSNVLALLEDHNAMIVGGALTSILTRKEVNDVDVYFKTKEDFIACCLSVINTGSDLLDDFELRYLGNSDKSITFSQKYREANVQFIYQSFYPELSDVFKDFDFTINMIGYDVKHKVVREHENAMQHLSQRILVTNGGTKFPLVSVLRLDKYKQRGYDVSKKEVLKLLLAVNNLNLNSYDDVTKHIGGLYGLAVEKIFDKTKPFSLEECIEQLCNIDFESSHLYVNKSWDDFTKFVENESGISDILKKVPYIKYVKQKDGKLVSHWDNDFEYKVGEVAVPKESRYGSSGIWCEQTVSECQYDDTLILVTPINEHETESPFKSGVMVETVLHNVKTDEDWLYFLVKEEYLTYDEAKLFASYKGIEQPTKPVLATNEIRTDLDWLFGDEE